MVNWLKVILGSTFTLCWDVWRERKVNDKRGGRRERVTLFILYLDVLKSRREERGVAILPLLWFLGGTERRG